MKPIEVTLLNNKGKEKIYKLGIGTRETVQLEKDLGTNIMGEYLEYIFQVSQIQQDIDNGNINEENAMSILGAVQGLSMEYIVTILHRALSKYDNKNTIDTTYDFVDLYMEQKEEGKMGIVALIGEILTEAGFFPKG